VLFFAHVTGKMRICGLLQYVKMHMLMRTKP